MYIKLVPIKIFQKIYNIFSLRAQSFFSFSQKQNSISYPPLVHFEIREQILDGHVPQELSDHIELHLKTGFQVKVTPLKTKISDEYIGILNYWNGEILESRQYLLLQVECVEKKTIVFRKIDSSIPLV